jgi:hypothetical protein
VTLTFPFDGVEGQNDRLKVKKKNVSLGELDVVNLEDATDGDLAGAILAQPFNDLKSQIAAARPIAWLEKCRFMLRDDCLKEANAPNDLALKEFSEAMKDAASGMNLQDLADNGKFAYVVAMSHEWKYDVSTNKATGTISLQPAFNKALLPQERDFRIDDKDSSIRNDYEITISTDPNLTWKVTSDINRRSLRDYIQLTRRVFDQIDDRKLLGNELRSVLGNTTDEKIVGADELAGWLVRIAAMKRGERPPVPANVPSLETIVAVVRDNQPKPVHTTHFFEFFYDGEDYVVLSWRATSDNPPNIVDPHVRRLGQLPYNATPDQVAEHFGNGFEDRLKDAVDGQLHILIGVDGSWVTDLKNTPNATFGVQEPKVSPAAGPSKIDSLKRIVELGDKAQLMMSVDQTLTIPPPVDQPHNEIEQLKICHEFGKRILLK